MGLKPRYYRHLEPVFPCEQMRTRHCPAIYDAKCLDVARPCARYDSEDTKPWEPEVDRDYVTEVRSEHD